MACFDCLYGPDYGGRNGGGCLGHICTTKGGNLGCDNYKSKPQTTPNIDINTLIDKDINKWKSDNEL